jgi:NAD(P)-dependent dehydrogenase (short-subunit alcohol dehydrogenase family)
MDVKGKGAVVTGAASGIGKAIATAFIDAGGSLTRGHSALLTGLKKP